MNNILILIDSRIHRFSKGQKKIANYVLSYYDKAAFMTASQLANEVNVSDSTVVRFATELDLDGYPSFQKELKELIKTNLTSSQRVEVTNSIFKNGDVVKKVLYSDIEKIKKTANDIDEVDFKNAVSAVLNSKDIYIVASRSSFALSNFFYYYMKMMFCNVYLINAVSTNVVLEEIIDISSKDLLIGITFPRYSKATIKGVRYAKSKDAKILSITDGLNSPICDYSDYNLLCNSDMTSFVDSLVSPMSVINALLVCLGHEKSEELQKRFNKLEDIWNRNDIYSKDDYIIGREDV
ncbi:MAG: MurR/RpiR family transcriptional regulator [Oscillospiraceae bacterium]